MQRARLWGQAACARGFAGSGGQRHGFDMSNRSEKKRKTTANSPGTWEATFIYLFRIILI